MGELPLNCSSKLQIPVSTRTVRRYLPLDTEPGETYSFSTLNALRAESRSAVLACDFFIVVTAYWTSS
jgi:hypothetical protein